MVGRKQDRRPAAGAYVVPEDLPVGVVVGTFGKFGVLRTKSATYAGPVHILEAMLEGGTDA